jgi:hypothetical protein
MHRQSAEFPTFIDALTCFVEHVTEKECHARLLGPGYDDENDGLNQEEREAVELAWETAA